MVAWVRTDMTFLIGSLNHKHNWCNEETKVKGPYEAWECNFVRPFLFFSNFSQTWGSAVFMDGWLL
jgi:hypothetical protein